MSPAAAVVVATRGRPARLRALLAALSRLEGPSFEVVVAVDGPDAETRCVLDAAPANLVLRAVDLPASRGPAAARNAGWRATSAPAVAFTDDDCEPAPGWLAALLAAAARAPGAVVQGPTRPHPRETHALGPFARTMHVTAPGPWFETCNILYPRSLLERLGGFDEAFPFPAGEDTDLGWRARAAGAPLAWAPDALVLHAVHPLGALTLARGAGRWATTVRVVRRHPGIRRVLHRRVFWKRAHERLLLAAALALPGSARGAAAAAGAWWLLGHRREHRSWARLVAAAPGHLLVDAAEVAAMVRGSVAARTLVL